MHHWTTEPLERRTLLSGGTADPSFGTGGITLFAPGSGAETFTRVAAGPNGTVYAAGRLNEQLLLARFTAAGALDPAFGGKGYVVYPADVLPESTGPGLDGALAVDPSGGVYVGAAVENDAGWTATILHYDAAGALDPHFGTAGVVSTQWDASPYAAVAFLKLLPDGDLLVGGDDRSTLVAARLLPSGGLDTSFNGTGISVLPFPNRDTLVFAQNGAVTPDGGLVMMGTESNTNLLARFDADGTVDGRFGFQGRTTLLQYNEFGYFRPGNGIAVDADGRVLIAGANTHPAVARLKADGTPDDGYGTDAVFTDTALSGSGSGLVLLADGDAALTAFVSYQDPATVLGVTPDGALDPTFGTGGATTLNGVYFDVAQALDGAVVMAGMRQSRTGTSDAVARLTAPGHTGTITGTVFDDANGNGVQDAGEADTGFSQIAYLDLNGNARPDPGEPSTYVPTGGGYTFRNVAVGTYTVRLSGDGAFAVRPTTPPGGGQTVTVADGQTTTAAPFGLQPVTYYAVNVAVFADANGNGVRDGGENYVAGRTVYADLNGNGALDSGEPSIATSGVGAARMGLEAGTYVLREVVPDGERQTGRTVSVAASGSTFVADGTVRVPQDSSGVNADPVLAFGVQTIPQAAAAGGTVYADANKNGKRDAAEAGVAGVTVYVDVNNNSKRDAGEVFTQTDAAGAFTLTGLADTGAATRLRVVLPNGDTQITPTKNYGYALNLTPGAANAGLAFGLYAPPAPPANTASIAGYAFDDNNKNGKYDAGDKYTGGKTVFLDLDNDGVLDKNESSVLTDSSGKFTFKNLAAGTYHVRRVFVSGYTYSTPKIDLVLTAGQAKTGLLIGTKKA